MILQLSNSINKDIILIGNTSFPESEMIAPKSAAQHQDAVASLLSASTADSFLGCSVLENGICNKSSQTKSRPCTVCQQITKFTCAECKDIYYCSRACRASDYYLHKKVCTHIFKPYAYKAQSRKFQNRIFCVEDFLKGPDQPLNPPDTEEYDDIQILWR